MLSLMCNWINHSLSILFFKSLYYISFFLMNEMHCQQQIILDHNMFLAERKLASKTRDLFLATGCWHSLEHNTIVTELGFNYQL